MERLHLFHCMEELPPETTPFLSCWSRWPIRSRLSSCFTIGESRVACDCLKGLKCLHIKIKIAEFFCIKRNFTRTKILENESVVSSLFCCKVENVRNCTKFR